MRVIYFLKHFNYFLQIEKKCVILKTTRVVFKAFAQKTKAMSHYMTDKLEFIGQANFTWMEIVSLRKYCNLCFKIHYVKVFRSFLSSFFWKRRKKANQRKKKKQVRPFPENSLKKHERILGTGDCRESSRKCVFSF